MSYKDYWDKFKTGRSSSGKKSSTFYSDVELFDDDANAGVSVSRTDRYVRDYDQKQGSHSNNDKLNRVACKLVRLINSVRNSRDGNESVITLKWDCAEDKKRDFDCSKNEISVDPEVGLIADDSPEILDSIGGRCLIAATQLKTVDPTQRKDAIAFSTLIKSGAIIDEIASHRKCQIIAWEAIESSKATKKLLDEWPGAAPYIHRHKVSNCASKDEVQNFVNDNENVEGVIAAYSWTMNNPSNPILLPSKIEEVLVEALETTETWQHDPDTFKCIADRVVQQIRSHLPFKKYDRNPSSGGGGGGDSKGEGSGGDGKNPKGDPKKDESKKDEEIPNSSDSTLLSEIKGSSISELNLPNPIKTNDDLDIFDVPVIPPGCGRFNKTVVVDVSKVKSYMDPIHVRSKEESIYKNLVSQSSNITKSIVSALRFRANESENPAYGFQSGDIDEGSFFKLATRRCSDTRIYKRREVVSFPHVLFGMLIDLSGSMSSSHLSSKSRIEEAQIVCVGIHEALKRIKKVDQYIAGHDANNGCFGGPDDVELYEFFTKEITNPKYLSRMTSGYNNADGYAIQKAVERMVVMHPEHRHKSLCVISDGEPAASGIGCSYSGGAAVKHIRNVCDWAWRKHRVRVIGIGVANAFPPEIGSKMYGEGNCAVIGDVAGSAMIISRFLQKVTSKMG